MYYNSLHNLKTVVGGLENRVTGIQALQTDKKQRIYHQVTYNGRSIISNDPDSTKYTNM
jgi:hypothetical protein